MKLSFTKYQGTGNDFVMLDNSKNTLAQLSTAQIIKICDRRFGIGADGLIIVQPHAEYDFEMIYYNSDGSQSLCGNGSRCAMMFARSLGLARDKAQFLAYDGAHEAFIVGPLVHFKMRDVEKTIQLSTEEYFINTGSPHHISFVEDVKTYPVYDKGAEIRYSESYKLAGTNVNFVEKISENSIFVRTYERGVENETLSCGTGVTAASLAAALRGAKSPVSIKALGGELQVSFKTSGNGQFSDIYLIGPAEEVFKGIIEI